MATFDQPGLRFDSAGVFFDAALVLSATTQRKMAKPKLDLKGKTDTELVAFAQAHVAAMTGNANYATPTPDAAAFAAQITAFNDAITEADSAQQAAQTKTAMKQDVRDLMELALTQRGNYVETASGGDEAKILSSGFDVRSAATPPVVPVAPADLGISMGDHTGEIDLQWTPSKGAKFYIIECAPYNTPRVWQQVKIVTRSSHTVTGLTPGDTYVFRVKAIGSAGDSDWSDEAVKMAP
ncbi:MAG: fibronectin type III domain-containing protein [Prosthecobacter sp.]|nr:fibronectin type III domain-containing protein [Prosthecobacter sp.]